MKKNIQMVRITVKAVIAGMFLVILSCSDFLDKPPQGQLSQNTFPVTADDALQATNAIYNILRDASYHSGTFPILDIMSDDAAKGSNPTDGASTVGTYNSFTHIPTEGNINNWWNVLYMGIKRANVVIEQVAEITMDENLKKRYMGEAYFLRALFYFDVVRAWGDAPLITTVSPGDNLERTPKDQIYNLIISDLTKAIDVLPEKSEYAAEDMGRATKGAAKGILAKVYLFLGDDTNAAKYALEVINSNEYELEENFGDANSKAGEFGSESIFEIGALPLEGLVNGGDQYANVQGVRGIPNRGWGFNRPTLDLMNAFEANDPRLDATVIFLGEVLDGITIAGDTGTPDETKDNNGATVEIECYSQKVWTPGDNVPTQFDHNRRILRYADVLLMAAEALNKNGNTTDALQYLNEVRERARGGNAAILPDITETNQNALNDIILHERRVELALEGHRFWDLVRTNKAEAVLGPLGFKKGKHELLPVPQTEMDLTGNAWQQNPMWNQ